MKTKLIKNIIGSTLTLTIVAALALSAQADNQVKGAQLLLQPSQTRVATEAPVSGATMNCAACKNVAVQGVRIEKGHILTATYGETHLCAKCETTIGVVGFGKAKKNVTTHTCAVPNSGCDMAAGS